MKKKIIYIITRLDKGGSSKILLQSAKALDKDIFEVKIISGLTTDPETDMDVYQIQNNVSIRFIPQLRRDIAPLSDIAAFMRLFFFLVKEKPDIVHTHTSKAGFLGRWAAYFAGVKHIIHTPHGHIFYGYYGRYVSSFFVFLEKLTSFITEKIITLTDLCKKEHIKRNIGTEDKLITIYNGVNIDDHERQDVDILDEKRKLCIPADAYVIGIFARLEPIKGIEVYLKAAVNIRKTIKDDVYTIIVGSGSLKDILMKKTSLLGLEDRIIFLGMREDYKKLIHICDIVALPSLNEGFGLILIEAGLCNKPVVASRVGGIPEVVLDGETGVLVPPKDSSALAETIISLLKDDVLRSKMGIAARANAKEKFSLEGMLENIFSLYKEILSIL